MGLVFVGNWQETSNRCVYLSCCLTHPHSHTHKHLSLSLSISIALCALTTTKQETAKALSPALGELLPSPSLVWLLVHLLKERKTHNVASPLSRPLRCCLHFSPSLPPPLLLLSLQWGWQVGTLSLSLVVPSLLTLACLPLVQVREHVCGEELVCFVVLLLTLDDV